MNSTTPTNRTWIVREGSTGTGAGLFCVYAATMVEARASASGSLDRAGVSGPFTVHATRPGQELPAVLTFARNVYTVAFAALPAA